MRENKIFWFFYPGGPLAACLVKFVWGSSQYLRLTFVEFFKVREMCQSRLDFTSMRGQFSTAAVSWQVQYSL